MANVPYTPYPTADPSTANTPGVQVNAPADAFGAGIATAIGGLGKQLERSSDELFQRAVAVQELRNDAEAREADTQYMIAAGKLHAEYNALQQNDAVKAAPKYFKDLDDVRVQIRDGLSNDRVKKLYDGSSRSTMGRSIFNGANHAAEAAKKYFIGSAKANDALIAKAAEDNPGDEVGFRDLVSRRVKSAKEVAGALGIDEGNPQEELMVKEAVSDMWYSKIKGIAKKDPVKAQEVFDANKTNLLRPHQESLENYVTSQFHSIYSANIAEKVYDPSGVKPLKQMQDDARKLSEEQRPGDQVLANRAVSTLNTLYNQRRSATKDEAQRNTSTVEGFIIDNPNILTEQQLRAVPGMSERIEQMPERERGKIQATINHYRQAATFKSNKQTFNELKALSSVDPARFLDLDLTEYKDLDRDDYNKLTVIRKERMDKVGEDPRVPRAMRMIRSAHGATLQALHIDRWTERYQADYYKYMGALQQALDVWQQDKKKPPSDDEIVKIIAPQLIEQQVTSPDTFFGRKEILGVPLTKTEVFFKQTVPDKFAKELTADLVSKGEKPPRPDQIQRAYMRAQLIELYGKPKSKPESGPPRSE
jgi:hypothetical protein